MNLTDIRIKLAGNQSNRLLAFCSIVLDNEFAIRDIRVLQGDHGIVVAMPCRKRTIKCDRCGTNNAFNATYCNHCGHEQKKLDLSREEQYQDVAHPICSESRTELNAAIIAKYLEVLNDEQCDSEPNEKSA
ncbi:MAG: SpoVG family protein [Pirellulaceae bacterium]